METFAPTAIRLSHRFEALRKDMEPVHWPKWLIFQGRSKICRSRSSDVARKSTSNSGPTDSSQWPVERDIWISVKTQEEKKLCPEKGLRASQWQWMIPWINAFHKMESTAILAIYFMLPRIPCAYWCIHFYKFWQALPSTELVYTNCKFWLSINKTFRRAVGPLAYFLDDDLGKSLALLGGSAADEAREVLAELSWQVMLIGENILEIFRRVINGVPYDKAQELLELFPFPFLLEGFGILFPLGSATVGFHF